MNHLEFPQNTPQPLIKICNFLRREDFSLSHQTRDGRINSAFNEDEIIKKIETRFPIQRPTVRDWADFSLEIDGEFIPVNIKVSAIKTADNLNCKLGIYFALTGRIPDLENNVNWENYFQALKENLTPNNKDYFFLIINKNDSSDVFLASLKTLKKVTPNGNNLPFQANWSENRTPVKRSYEEAKNFILSHFYQSLVLRANAYTSFLRYFGECQ